MLSLYEDPEDSIKEPLINGDIDISKLDKKKIKKTIMKTPCNHRFHVNCLLEWTKVKLECPTCRNHLPSME